MVKALSMQKEKYINIDRFDYFIHQWFDIVSKKLSCAADALSIRRSFVEQKWTHLHGVWLYNLL